MIRLGCILQENDKNSTVITTHVRKCVKLSPNVLSSEIIYNLDFDGFNLSQFISV